MTLTRKGYHRLTSALASIVLLAFVLSAPACAQKTKNETAAMNKTQEETAKPDPALGEPHQSALKAELISVMEAVKKDWNAGNYDGLKLHWDLTDDAPLYIAEESDIVMTNWPEVEKYWSGTDAWNEWIVVDYYNYHAKHVDDNNAIVTFDLRFDVKLNDRPKPIGGDNRGVVSLRKVDGEWKIYSWVEAPLAAITYMRKLYELNVRDGLPANNAPEK